MADPLDRILGSVLTMPDGPWEGKRVRVLRQVMPPSGQVPIPYYALQRLDTGEIGHRMYIQVMLMAATQGVFRKEGDHGAS